MKQMEFQIHRTVSRNGRAEHELDTRLVEFGN
jgi:hypothetical protein